MERLSSRGTVPMEKNITSEGSDMSADAISTSGNYVQASEQTITDYRRRLVHTAVYYYGFFVFGWVIGQRGAAFLDLLLVTQTDMAEGSILFMLAGLASIAGGLAGGFLLDLTGRPLLLMSIVFMVNAAVNSTLALCEPLALMSTLYFISHFTLSIVDVGSSAHLVNILPERSSAGILQGLHFMFSVGAILSPLATQPFLAPRRNDSDAIESQKTEWQAGDEQVFFANHTDSVLQNVTELPIQVPGLKKETRVLYALLVTGGLCFLSGLFLIMLMKIPIQEHKHKGKSKQKEQMSSKMRKLYIAALISLGVYNFFGSSVEDVFPYYLMTFVVRELDWSKTNGARITSVYWVGLATGRLSGVALIRLLPVKKIIIGCLVAMITGQALLFLAAKFHLHWMVWIAAGWVGLATSVLFPSGLIYAHQHVAQLTGKLASLIFTTPMIAAMIIPMVLAKLMSRYDNLWYVYIFIIQTGLALACFLFLHSISISLAKCRSQSQETHTEMEDKSEDKTSQPFLEEKAVEA